MEKQRKIANQLKESDIRYYSSPEAQELPRLKEAINRTPEEKFIYLMNLIKLQKTMTPSNRYSTPQWICLPKDFWHFNYFSNKGLKISGATF